MIILTEWYVQSAGSGSSASQHSQAMEPAEDLPSGIPSRIATVAACCPGCGSLTQRHSLWCMGNYGADGADDEEDWEGVCPRGGTCPYCDSPCDLPPCRHAPGQPCLCPRRDCSFLGRSWFMPRPAIMLMEDIDKATMDNIFGFCQLSPSCRDNGIACCNRRANMTWRRMKRLVAKRMLRHAALHVSRITRWTKILAPYRQFFLDLDDIL